METLKSETNPDDLLTPEQLTDQYSKELAGFFDVERVEGIETIVFDSMDDLKRAFTEYLTERYKALGKEGAPPEPPIYLKGYNPGGPKWKEIWIAKWGTPDEHGHNIERGAFNQRLKHELTHIYIHAIAKITKTEKDDYVPNWLNEGISCLLAGQAPSEPGLITMGTLRSLDKALDSANYRVGSKMVRMIIEQYGEDKLIELIKMPRHEQLYDELQRMFEWLK
jgi:hypothetical protein